METPTLLGYLARFHSFTTQSEVLCTQGLAYLLKTSEEARLALAAEVEERTGITITDTLTWWPELKQADGGRPDLEAITDDDVPIVKIEAKLGAELFAAQLKSYVNDLHARNSGESALLVLVPKARIAEAARVTAAAFGLKEPGPWKVTDGHRTGIAVISWDEIFDVLIACDTERFRYELEQLQSMYRVLMGDYIAPLASDEDLRRWRDSDTNFLIVVDQVTRQLTTQHRLYPLALETLANAEPECEPDSYHRRYVCASADNLASCYCIGVRDPFEGHETPIWMRFRKDTGEFMSIRQRIEASSTLEWLESGGHIWIPLLDIPRNVSSEQMIQALVEQAQEVVRVAYRAE
jgi:hypothetical protein